MWWEDEWWKGGLWERVWVARGVWERMWVEQGCQSIPRCCIAIHGTGVYSPRPFYRCERWRWLTGRVWRYQPRIGIGGGRFRATRWVWIDIQLHRRTSASSGDIISRSYTVQYTPIGNTAGAADEESGSSRECSGATAATGSAVTIPVTGWREVKQVRVKLGQN